MNGHLGPVEVECDAPPYAVVQACAYLGFDRPLDVRWRPARELTPAGGWAAASGTGAVRVPSHPRLADQDFPGRNRGGSRPREASRIGREKRINW